MPAALAQEDEAGGLPQGHFILYNKYQVRQGHIARPCPKKERESQEKGKRRREGRGGEGRGGEGGRREGRREGLEGEGRGEGRRGDNYMQAQEQGYNIPNHAFHARVELESTVPIQVLASSVSIGRYTHAHFTSLQLCCTPTLILPNTL